MQLYKNGGQRLSMNDAEIQGVLSDAKGIMNEYKSRIQEVLSSIEAYKNVDLENADIKEDYDNMLKDISVKLNEIINEIGN